MKYSNSSSHGREALAPQRSSGRQRVSDILEAAAAAFDEKGYEGATMAEIATRANARVGSLYRFFPNKDVVAQALVNQYVAMLMAEFEIVHELSKRSTSSELADTLIDLLVKLHPHAKAMMALLDSRPEWPEIRLSLRDQALEGVRKALLLCMPSLDAGTADDASVVVLNNMKTMLAMVARDAPTSPGAPEQLRFMNRLYLGATLDPPFDQSRSTPTE